jgi:putative transposase
VVRVDRWDRALWVGLARLGTGWQQVLTIVQPATVVRWHRDGFRRFWTRRSRAGVGGRPTMSRETRTLIRRMSGGNPTWGAPRIRNELAKLASAG